MPCICYGAKIKVKPIEPIESLPIPRRWIDEKEAKEMFPLDVIGIDEEKLEQHLMILKSGIHESVTK